MFLIWCQELGAAALSLPAASTTEHPGSGISEPLLNTGDALDKYQIVAQKVVKFVCSLCILILSYWVSANGFHILSSCVSECTKQLSMSGLIYSFLNPF